MLKRYAYIAGKRVLEKALGIQIVRSIPAGCDFFLDLKVLLPKFIPQVVFDVGANTGQSALEYLKHFKNPHIYCFEPVKSTFDLLNETLSGKPNVVCVNLGLSSAKKNAPMRLDGSSDEYRLIHVGEPESENVIDVQLETVESFCDRVKLSRINFLKIDTEGHDLEVLKGSERLLQNQTIDVLQVEAAMNPLNRLHVDLQEFRKFLEPRGYFLFKLYEQSEERYTGHPNLRRTNPVFIF